MITRSVATALVRTAGSLLLTLSLFVTPGSAQDGLILVTVSRPQPLGHGATDEMVERLGQALIDQLREVLPRSRYQVQQEANKTQASTGSQDSDQPAQYHYRLTVSYAKKESGEYEIFSDLYEGEERSQPTATIHRLCASGSGLVQCNLKEIASFHVPYILRSKRPRRKQFFLELDYEAHGGRQSPDVQKAQEALERRALEHELKSNLLSRGWSSVDWACYADYIFHVEAVAVDQDLTLKVTVEDANNGNLPYPRSYEPEDSERLEDFVNPKGTRAEQWVVRFTGWLQRQGIK